MADVDMTDAPTTSGGAPKGKVVAKGLKGPPGEVEGDGKKRFEVKKVRRFTPCTSPTYSRQKYLNDLSGTLSLSGPGT